MAIVTTHVSLGCLSACAQHRTAGPPLPRGLPARHSFKIVGRWALHAQRPVPRSNIHEVVRGYDQDSRRPLTRGHAILPAPMPQQDDVSWTFPPLLNQPHPHDVAVPEHAVNVCVADCRPPFQHLVPPREYDLAWRWTRSGDCSRRRPRPATSGSLGELPSGAACLGTWDCLSMPRPIPRFPQDICYDDGRALGEWMPFAQQFT